MNALLPGLRFDKNDLSNLEEAIRREWIQANGMGGYASSTVLGINTRKYHGLLVPSFNPPADRRVTLSKLDEQIFVDGEASPLAANEFNQGIHPHGYGILDDFAQSPFPRYTYRVDDVPLRKTIIIPHRRNAVVVIYESTDSLKKKVTLQASPLISSRYFHTVTQRAKLGWSFVQKPSKQKAAVQVASPQSTLLISSSSGKYHPCERWIENILYRVDRSLGTSCYDDCYVPGMFEIDLNESPRFCVVAVAGRSSEEAETDFSSISTEMANPENFYRRELERLTMRLQEFQRQHPGAPQADWLKCLILAADSFIVDRLSTKAKTVIAGYHWFEDWGRDSMISLPGLTLVTGRHNDAKEILLTFAHYCRNGIIPNRFPDAVDEQPSYNTVDATLWFFHAVLQYLKYTGDFSFVRQRLWTTLQSVVDYHVQGTINDIHLDNDGLIAHGSQLTWMDAMVHGNPVTPREGKAVEVQALWYNALKIMELLAHRYGQKSRAEEYNGMARKARESFVEKFWDNQAGCLCDVLHESARDRSLRPNQVFAVSLDFSMLGEVQQSSIVAVIREKLWTKYGLRTLSADDPHYRGRYVGDWAERDLAYHNGTVWPWLLGHFVTAFLKVKHYEAECRMSAFDNFLSPLFEQQILCAGIGTLSEVFDGDPPHAPGGCVAQAWSVAEPLRAYVEDVLFRRPVFERTIADGLSSGEDK